MSAVMMMSQYNHQNHHPQPSILMARPGSSGSCSSSIKRDTSSASLSYVSPTSPYAYAASPPQSECGTPRRIRFAPLPDPRRDSLIFTDDENEEVNEDGEIPAAVAPVDATPTKSEPPFACAAERTQCSIMPARSTTPPPPMPSRTSSTTSSSSGSSSTRGSPPLPPSSRLPEPPASPLEPPRKRRSLFGFGGSSANRRASSPLPPPSRADTESCESTDVDEESDGKKGSFGTMFSAEEILTLGTINLFRTSSNASSGIPLERTQSVQSSASTKARRRSKLIPSFFSSSSSKAKEQVNSNELTRSVSLGGGAAPKPGKVHGTLSVPLSTNSVRKGTKMLNGRVYGGRRGHTSPTQNANPFANARDEESDPAFVEWGYGGMGSVRSAQDVGGGSVWNRLQSSDQNVFGSTTSPISPSKSTSTGTPEEEAQREKHEREATTGETEAPDDGSGMAWIRRRREAREKAKKEAEELAAAAADSTSTSSSPPSTSPPTDSTSAADPTPTDTQPQLCDEPAEIEIEVEAANTPRQEKHEFIGPSSGTSTPRAMSYNSNVLTPLSSSSIAPSNSNSNMRSKPPRTFSGSSAIRVSMDKEAAVVEHDVGIEQPTAVIKPTAKAGSDGSGSGSETSEDEAQDDEDEDSEDDDDEDEDERDVEGRKTAQALGAGVEKISRHKEHASTEL